MAETDADTDIKFFKIRGHGQETDSPRTRVSTELWLNMSTTLMLKRLEIRFSGIQPNKRQLQSRQSQIDSLKSENERIENSEESCRSDLKEEKSNYKTLEERIYDMVLKSEFHLSC